MLQTRIEELKQYAFVIKQLSLKEHKRKTDETNLGVVWNVLNPLLYMVILSTFYSDIVPRKIDNFPIFCFSGLIVLNFYNEGTMGAMYCLNINKQLLIKSHVPIWIFIAQSILTAVRDMFFSFVAFSLIMLYFKVGLTIRALEILPILVLTIIVTLNIGTILSVCYIFFADIAYLYSLVMTMMFFISGVFLPVEMLPAKLHWVLSFNPIFLSIYLMRNSLIYNIESHWSAWAKLIIWAFVSFMLGLYMVKKCSNRLLNRI